MTSAPILRDRPLAGSVQLPKPVEPYSRDVKHADYRHRLNPGRITTFIEGLELVSRKSALRFPDHLLHRYLQRSTEDNPLEQGSQELSPLTVVVDTVQGLFDDSSVEEDLQSQRGFLLNYLAETCAIFGVLPTQYRLHEVHFESTEYELMHQALYFRGTQASNSVFVRTSYQFGWPIDSTHRRDYVKVIARELVGHRQLRHPNVQPLLGVFYEAGLSPKVILPRMGHSLDYRRPLSSESYVKIVSGIAAGVAYLHQFDPPIVHGNICPDSVTLTHEGEPVLGNFSMIRIRAGAPPACSPFPLPRATRFTAPELLSLSDHSTLCHTEASDAYAFAMTIFAIGAGKDPFANKTDSQVTQLTQSGIRPAQLDSLGCLNQEQSNFLWDLLSRMWVQAPRNRLSSTLFELNTVSLRNHVLDASIALKPLALSFTRLKHPRRVGTMDSAMSVQNSVTIVPRSTMASTQVRGLVNAMKHAVKPVAAFLQGREGLEETIIDLPEGEPADNGRIMQHFGTMNREILGMCEDLVPPPSCVPGSEGECEHAHFKFVAAVNSLLDDRIFGRFHPSLPKDASDSCNRRYLERFESERAILVSQARVREFEAIARLAGKVEDARVKTEIQSLILSELRALFRPNEVPADAETKIAAVIDLAYQWNHMIRGLNVDHLYRPFFPVVGSIYDAESSTPYHKYPFDLSKAVVRGIVSMGAEISDITAQVNSSEYSVQKGGLACVLLDVE